MTGPVERLLTRTGSEIGLGTWMGRAQEFGKRALFVFSLALLFSLAAKAGAGPSLDQYRQSHWGPEQGFSNANFFAQDRSGALWIAAAQGPLRFDGLNFQPMTELRSSIPTRLLASRTGAIWVAYDRDSLIETYSKGRWSARPAPGKKAFVIQLREAKDGSILALLGRLKDPLVRWTGRSWQVIGRDWNFPSSGFPIDVLPTVDGSIYLTMSDGVFRLPTGSRAFARIGDVRGHAALAADHAGRVWMSDDEGTRLIAPRRSAIVARTPKFLRAVWTMVDSKGNLWGAGSAGAFKVRLPPVRMFGDFPVQQAEALVSTANEPVGSGRAAFEDREGNIWIGTSIGMFKLRIPPITTDTRIGSIPTFGFLVRNIDGGDILIGARHKVWRQGSDGNRQLIAQGLADVTAVCGKKEDAFWVFQRKALTQVTPSGSRTITLALPEDVKVNDCLADAPGSVIYAAEDGHLVRRFLDGRSEAIQGVGARDVARLVRDPTGRILAGARDGTIAEIKGGKTRVLAKSALLAGLVDLLPIGADLLALTNRSLVWVHEGRARAITDATYPWLRLLSGAGMDRDGTIWLFGAAGLIRLDRALIHEALEHPGVPLNPRIFDIRDGLLDGNSASLTRDLAVDRQGTVWIASRAGLSSLNSRTWDINRVAPGVTVTALISAGKRYVDPAAVRLEPADRTIEISFQVNSLRVPERVMVRYRLVGVDKKWVDPGQRRQAFYNDLGAGSYRFEVMAANDDGVWNRKGAVLAFTMEPSFVETIWFKLLLLVALLICAYLIYALRMHFVMQQMQRRMEVRVAERERIAREIHDTLLQGWQGLMLMFQGVAHRLPEPMPERRQLMDALDKAEMVLNDGRDKIRELRSDAEFDLPYFLQHTGTRFWRGSHTFSLKTMGKPRALAADVCVEIREIAKEAMRNAHRHARADKIVATIEFGDDALLLTVVDDGIGFDQGAVAEGRFGLMGMKERAGHAGGSLTITSDAGGTRVSISVPAAKAYQRSHGFWYRLRGRIALVSS